MNYKEFSRRIKAKYPAYNDMDDLTLAQSVIGKYPQYADVTFDDQDNFIQSAANTIKQVKSDIGEITSPLINSAKPYFEATEFSPQTNLMKIDSMIRSAADKSGNLVAEDYASKGMNPYMSGAIGTAVSMSPDMASFAIPGNEGASFFEKEGMREIGGLRRGAKKLFGRALGFTKKHRINPRQRRNVDVASDVAYENDIVPWFGNATTMQERVNALKNKATSGINSFLKKPRIKSVSVPDEDVNAFVSRPRPLALPEPGKRSPTSYGPAQFRPGQSANVDTSVHVYKPGSSPTQSELYRFRKLGWEEVDPEFLSDLPSGTRVFANPNHPGLFRPEFYSKSNQVGRMVPDTGVPFGKSERVHGYGIKDGESLKLFAKRRRLSANESPVTPQSKKSLKVYPSEERVGFDSDSAIKRLEELRYRLTDGGGRGGAYDAINQKIDNAIETIKGHGDGFISFEKANKIKSTLQDLGNYKTNSQATKLDKDIAAAYRRNLDAQLAEISRKTGDIKGYREFMKSKRDYGAAETMDEGINNKLASEGNEPVALKPVIAAAPALASGHPSLAGIIAGAYQMMNKSGSAAIGRSMKTLAQSGGTVPFAFTETSRILTDKNLARKYMEAAKWIKDKARELAAQDGWRF